jgi:hypothetical protein
MPGGVGGDQPATGRPYPDLAMSPLGAIPRIAHYAMADLRCAPCLIAPLRGLYCCSKEFPSYLVDRLY